MAGALLSLAARPSRMFRRRREDSPSGCFHYIDFAMSIRTERVAELVQREVARILQRDYADQLKPMVTITNARVTPDLSIAYLYASVLGDTTAKREATFKQLESLTPEIKDKLASRIRHQLRTMPDIQFFLDESLQKAKKMENLFDRIREERERRESRKEPEAELPDDADS
jgi:ribosome-binding factor A